MPTRLRELGAFLRSRRGRIRPEDVDLPPGSRRRTPGLRREEVAQLAGVGLTWYTWLEQGRDIRVSPKVLCSIAHALQLEPAERVHLFRLAGHEPPDGFGGEAVRLAHARVLERWDPYPAYITGRRWDVLAWNRGAAAIFGDYAQVPDGRRNLLWLMFTRPERRQLLRDWAREVERMVATFRAEAVTYLDEPAFLSLLSELRAESPDFAALWDRRDVQGGTDGLKRLRHPTLGDLELEHTTYAIQDQPGLKLRLYTPVPGSPTEAALRRLDLAAPVPASVGKSD
jgi:transcriptional regulator with XRE-family HTH domain